MLEDSNGMKRIKYLILIFGLIAGFGLIAFPATAWAKSALDATCEKTPDTEVCLNRDTDKFPTIVGQIVNALLYVLGAVAVIVIIIAGILFATASGDPALITKAKNTLLYAVIGLIVAILAYAIVNYVIKIFA